MWSRKCTKRGLGKSRASVQPINDTRPPAEGVAGLKPSPHPLHQPVCPAGRLHQPESNHPERAPSGTAQDAPGACSCSEQGAASARKNGAGGCRGGLRPSSAPLRWMATGGPPPAQGFRYHTEAQVDQAPKVQPGRDRKIVPSKCTHRWRKTDTEQIIT